MTAIIVDREELQTATTVMEMINDGFYMFLLLDIHEPNRNNETNHRQGAGLRMALPVANWNQERLVGT